MELTFLGTGTSHGVPVIGCDCPVCTSTNSKDKRYRSSVYITADDNKKFIVDTTPEFRIQCLEHSISHLDAVFITHSHADHLHGIDDLRIFSSVQSKEIQEKMKKKGKEQKPPLPVYTNAKCCNDLRFRLPYIFKPVKEGGGHANIDLIAAETTFSFGTTTITPIPMLHGHLETTGWLFSTKDSNQKINSVAYLTDCNYISEDSFKLIKNNCGNLKHLIIDSLRVEPHSTHFNFLQSMEAAEKIGCAQQIWFTHLTHHHSHTEVQKYIDENISKFPKLQKAKSVSPAYDNLTIHI